MAKRKATNRRRPSRQPRRSPRSEGGFFNFVTQAPVRRLLLTIAIVAVIWWQWGNITTAAENTWALFGWGLLIIAGAICTIIGVIWAKKVLSVIYNWNKWLGGIAFVFIAWGILAFLDLGGSFGDGIIGGNAFLGVLRLIGLAIVGIAFIIPKPFFRAIGRFFVWMAERIKQARAARPKPVELPVTEEKPAVPPPVVTVETAAPATEEPKAVPAAATPAEPQRGLRQVAEEVWKKYGQSPGLVTVNGWRLPPLDILDSIPEVEIGQVDNNKRARVIEEALASYGVEAKVVQINAGPTVTQFGIEPGWDRKLKEIKEKDRDGNVKVRVEEVSKTRVKVEKITSLANDLALALAAPSIRLEAPIPGKSVVGIEVPNTTFGMVGLRGVIESSPFQKIQARSKLALALGKGAGGEAVAGDLTRMPHLLIAGATGSGKTVCLNASICCLLLHNAPCDLQFIMIDPKRVELTSYNSIPHLKTPVIVDTNKALGTLRWLNSEMDKRYRTLATSGARNVEGYNKGRSTEDKMPYLVLVIDELADLMMAGFDEVEHVLCRLAQLARATGIHLIVATQRPSVDVVTGLIKANFPTRISFAVTSQVDSRTILDMGGAEKLLGRGDMLYMPTEAGKPKRLQGCLVSDTEVERLVYFWGSQKQEETPSLAIEEISLPPTGGRGLAMPEDPLIEEARRLAREHKHISTSYLQRRLRIGYPRAARLMEQLEEEGFRRGE